MTNLHRIIKINNEFKHFPVQTNDTYLILTMITEVLFVLLTSTLPKNQAAPIEKVIGDLFRIPKMFGAFVSLWHKSPKAKGKL